MSNTPPEILEEDADVQIDPEGLCRRMMLELRDNPLRNLLGSHVQQLLDDFAASSASDSESTSGNDQNVFQTDLPARVTTYAVDMPVYNQSSHQDQANTSGHTWPDSKTRHDSLEPSQTRLDKRRRSVNEHGSSIPNLARVIDQVTKDHQLDKGIAECLSNNVHLIQLWADKSKALLQDEGVNIYRKARHAFKFRVEVGTAGEHSIFAYFYPNSRGGKPEVTLYVMDEQNQQAKKSIVDKDNRVREENVHWYQPFSSATRDIRKAKQVMLLFFILANELYDIDSSAKFQYSKREWKDLVRVLKAVEKNRTCTRRLHASPEPTDGNSHHSEMKATYGPIKFVYWTPE